MEINGKYGSAIVYTDDIEQEAISQIINVLNQPWAEGSHIRIMSDVHAGAGCVIGYTARLTDKIVPNLIGVDISCSMAAYHLGHESNIGMPFDKLDRFIRDNIPSGMTANSHYNRNELENIFNAFFVKNSKIRHFKDFEERVNEIIDRMGMKKQHIFNSIGTLGSGNHFICISRASDGQLYAVVHSGSRNFGKCIAEYHQRIAVHSQLTIPREEFDKEVEYIKTIKKGKGIQIAIDEYRKSVTKKTPTGLEYLSGDEAQKYFDDSYIAQIYSQLSRRVILDRIVKFFKQKYSEENVIESMHNFIDFEHGIIRKGATPAYEGQKLLIPLSMADGILYCEGKGNEEWNYSCPHGAGRKMSRSKAKETIRLEDFQFKMKQAGVWSSSVGKDTLDEAPQAYKSPKNIIDNIEDSATIIDQWKEVYNFKAGGKE